MLRSHKRLRLPCLHTLALVCVLVGILAIQQTIPLTYAQSQPDLLGTLSGTVRNESGDPLPNISVFTINNFDRRSTKTDANGFYQLLSLIPGSYHVRFEDEANVYAKTYYANGVLKSEATPVNISGNTVTGIDVVMTRAATISVTIDSALAYSLTEVTTILYRKTATNRWEEYERMRWRDSGRDGGTDITFVFNGIANGTYALCVGVELYPFPQNQGECYDNVRPSSQLDGVKEIPVTPGSHQSVALLLGDFHQLQGYVKSTTGEPLTNGWVYAWKVIGGSLPYSVQTDSQGHFYFDGLEEDKYTIQAFALEYLPIFYDGAASKENAIHLEIGGTSRYSLTLTLPLGGSITGTILLEGGGIPRMAEVRALRVDSTGKLVEPEYGRSYSTWSDPVTGAYTITGLETGTYRVQAAFTSYALGDTTSFYGGEDFESADDVSVTASKTTPNINIALGTAMFEGSIMGKVIANGLPKAGIEVGLWMVTDQDSGLWYAPMVATVTNANGMYRFNGLASGNYYVGYRDPLGDYAITFFGGNPLAPAVVTLSSGETREGIDAQLTRGSTIRGKIRRAGGKNAADFRLSLSDVSGNYLLRYVDVLSDINGDYEIAGVPAGAYSITATPPYPYAYYEPKQIAVAENVIIEGVDFLIDGQPNAYLPLLKKKQ